MILADSHSHIYFDDFDNDLEQIIINAKNNSVEYIFIPATDNKFLDKTLSICKTYPKVCFPMIGMHPTSVKDDNYIDEISGFKPYLEQHKFCAVGETGIDLYWDKTFLEQQTISFKKHIKLALELDLPLVIHTRNSFDETFNILKENFDTKLKGVFHCFSGNSEQAKAVIDLGFKIGITGVVTYKNSSMVDVVKTSGLENIMLETDAPFLTPVPFRGKRNEPAYIFNIALKVAEILNTGMQTVADTTTANTLKLYIG